LPTLGGHYEDGYSTNPIWSADYQALPAHPVFAGVSPFALNDEWYYGLRFADGQAGRLTPLLFAAPPDSTRVTEGTASRPGQPETTAWAFERADGGRSFGYTGGHYHRNWGVEQARRLVVNAILWTAGRELPPGGAPVALDEATLDDNLDPK
jgi:type 1 glutamine amidotransferase